MIAQTVKQKPKANLNGFSTGTEIIFHIILGVFALVCIIPFLFVVIISFTSEESIRAIGYSFVPQSWSFQAYDYVFAMGGALWRSYYNSFLITIIGTVASVDICVLYSYPLFRKDFKYRNFFNYFSFITMIFGGGLIPTVVICKTVLGLNDNYAALIVPMLFSPFNIIVMRTFFQTSVPMELIEAATIEGNDGKGIYAINGYKDVATQNCWDVNVTLLNELGYTLDDFKAMDFYSFGELFAKAKEVKGDSFYPFLIEPMVLERMVTNSIIVAGDSGSTNLLSLYLNPEDVSADGAYGNVLLNKFATPEYQKFVEKMHEYYEAGYVDPALAVAETSNDARTAAQLSANYLIGTQSYALGYEYTASAERGIEVAFVPCTDPYVDTTASQGAMVAINSASNYPVESFKFLALLNSDPYLMTLLNYGVEGIHYTKNADGLIEFTEARASYTPWTNGMGNVTILPDTAAEGAGFRKTFVEFYGGAKGIPSLGFVFNNTEVTNEMAALSNVAAQYALALDAGAVDPATVLPEFLAALDAAGMQTYLDAANTQLEAYLAK